ncbi:MAG: dicarboxylate/amino acid:cation symporter [Selenomonadaceae bacterium]|nr:dicarboxylate/amino acid:cation symporter [Selenomonadaceae bacterium]
MTSNIFHVTGETYGEAVRWLAEEFSKTKTTPEERQTAELLFEECFSRMEEAASSAGDFSATLRLRRRWGDVSLILSAKEEAFNPLAGPKELAEADEEEAVSLSILLAHKDKISYGRKNGENIVSIKVHEASGKQTVKVFAAIVLGILAGILMKGHLGETAAQSVDYFFLSSVQTMFMNALSMMVAPMVFFAVLSGITGISDASDVGRLGGRLVGVSLAKLFATTVLGIAAGFFLFHDGMPELLPMIPVGDAPAADFSLRDMVVGIVPNSLVTPFFGGSILQVLFLACLFGVMINRAGDRAMLAKELIEFMNRLCMDVLDVIVQFIPLVVFASMAKLMMSVGFDVLLSLGQVVIADVVGTVLVMLVAAAFVAAFGKMSPVAFLKDAAGFAPIPFALNSSNACLPQALAFCEEKFGIRKKLAMFTLPVGIQFNMNGTGFYIILVSVLMARTVGVALNADMLLSLLLSAFIVSFTLPGCPGASLIGLSSVFEAVGIPVGAVALFLCIDPIISMLSTVGNVTSNIASTLIAGKESRE